MAVFHILSIRNHFLTKYIFQMRYIILLFLGMALFQSCEVEEIQPPFEDAELPDAWVEHLSCEAGGNILFEGESYSVTTTIDFDNDDKWKPNVSLWLSKSIDCHVDQSQPGTHVYSGFYTPSDPWSVYIHHENWLNQDGPLTFQTSGSSEDLYINPMFWDNSPDPNQPWIRPFGEYYLISIVDGNMTFNEQNEGAANVEYETVWVMPNSAINENIDDLKEFYSLVYPLYD